MPPGNFRRRRRGAQELSTPPSVPASGDRDQGRRRRRRPRDADRAERRRDRRGVRAMPVGGPRRVWQRRALRRAPDASERAISRCRLPATDRTSRSICSSANARFSGAIRSWWRSRPAPVSRADLREQIIAAAVRIARAVRYSSLGTFEFLVRRRKTWANGEAPVIFLYRGESTAPGRAYRYGRGDRRRSGQAAVAPCRWGEAGESWGDAACDSGAARVSRSRRESISKSIERGRSGEARRRHADRIRSALRPRLARR